MDTSAQAPALSDWLLQQIAEDEAVVARIDRPDDAEPSVLWPAMDDRAMGYNGSVWITPARVLAECEAKRRIVELHHSYPFGATRLACDADGSIDYPCSTLRMLAAPYADRPGYRPEWLHRG